MPDSPELESPLSGCHSEFRVIGAFGFLVENRRCPNDDHFWLLVGFGLQRFFNQGRRLAADSAAGDVVVRLRGQSPQRRRPPSRPPNALRTSSFSRTTSAGEC